MRTSSTVARMFALACALGSSPASALDACGLLTDGEAAELLGTSPGERTGDVSAAGGPVCVIRAREPAAGLLELQLASVSREDAPRLLKHLDEARGDEVPTMHGEPWYTLSVPDPERPDARRMVVYRDRTSLTLDLWSPGQKDAKTAFEAMWSEIAMRLPEEER